MDLGQGQVLVDDQEVVVLQKWSHLALAAEVSEADGGPGST